MNWKNHLNNVFIISMLLLLASCGGGTGGAGGSDNRTGLPASGTVSGVAHDNVLIGSTITVRSFTGGKAGAVLGSGKTDQSGNYSVNINSISTPLIIEARGGSYVEEASGITVNLGPTQMLRAVINYTEGSAVDVSITPYTNLAAGLAAYRGKKSAATDSNAIDAANQEIGNWLGFSLTAVKPRNITNAANVTSVAANDYSYGLISAAISSWTKYAATKNGQQHAVLSSVAFADSMYQDVVADGLLDGNGSDATGAAAPITFGSILLSRDVYRYALAAHVVQIANDTTVNKTGLTESAVLPFARRYSADIGSIWNAVAPLPFTTGRPAISFNIPVLNQVLRGPAVPVTGTVTGLGTVDSVTLSIDNQTVGTPVATSKPSFSFNSQNYVDFINHALKISVLDSFGITASQSLTVTVDNKTPTVGIDFTSPIAGDTVRGPSVTVYGNVSPGVGTASSATLSFDGNIVGTAANPNSPIFTFNSIGYSGPHTLTLDVTDSFNIRTSKMIPVTVDNTTPTVTVAFSSPAANSWVSGTAVSVNASVSGIGIPAASASFSIGNVVVSSTTLNPTNPAFTFNSTAYADGPHTLNVGVVDSFGIPAAQAQVVNFDNTSPTLAVTATSNAYLNTYVTGTMSDVGAGVDALWVSGNSTTTLPAAWSGPIYPGVGGAWMTFTGGVSSAYLFLQVRDKAGNCSAYRATSGTTVCTPPPLGSTQIGTCRPFVIPAASAFTLVSTGYHC